MKGAQAQVHKVQQACLFETGRYLLGVLQGQAAPGMHLVRVQPDAEDKVRTDGPSNRLNDLPAEAHAVLKAAPVFIFPEICGRRQELPDQGTVAYLELNAVETPFGRVKGAPGIVVDAFPNILDLHLLAGLPEDRILARRRAPDREP